MVGSKALPSFFVVSIKNRRGYSFLITLDVPYRLNQKNWTPLTWAYKRFGKRIETVFSQLNDHLMMIRNYAKKPSGLFARIEAKVAALLCCSMSIFSIINPSGKLSMHYFNSTNRYLHYLEY